MNTEETRIANPLTEGQPETPEAADRAVDQIADQAEPKKGAVVPDLAEAERIANKRSEQGVRAAVKDYLKQQGMTEEEAEQAFAQFNAEREKKREAERNDLTALQQRVDSHEKEMKDIVTMANLRLVRGEAMVKAGQMNIRPDRVEQAIRLADLTKVEVDDSGNVDDALLTAALEQVTKEMPELLISNDEGKHGFKLGASDPDQEASDDQISKIFGNN